MKNKILVILTFIIVAHCAVAAAGDDFTTHKYRYDEADKSYQQVPQRQGYESPTVISNQWDNKGRHYAPTGRRGNAWRSDGVFMIKVSGGYVNSRTGEFVPGK